MHTRRKPENRALCRCAGALKERQTQKKEGQSKITEKALEKKLRSVPPIPLPDESPNRDIPPTKSRQQASGDTTPWFVHPGAAPQLLATK